MTHYVEIYQAADGWRWRLRNIRNKKIVAESGEAYTRERDAKRAFTAIQDATLGLKVRTDW